MPLGEVVWRFPAWIRQLSQRPRLLGRVGGDSGAAAKLGMKRTTLQAKMRKLGIGAKDF